MKLLTSLCACFAIFIFGGCAKFQLRSPSVKPATLTDIVNDVEVNGTRSKYKGQKVTITAAGRIYPSADGDPPRLELFTHHKKVRFFITDPDTKFVQHYYSNYMESDLGHIRGHTTYTFTLLITDISEDTTAHGNRFFTISSDVPEHTAKADIEVIDTTLEQIVVGGQRYVGKTVRLQNETVSLKRLNELLGVRDDVDSEWVKNYSGAMTLDTNNRNVTFWIIDDVAGDGLFPSKLQKYENHQMYTFTLYVESIVTDGVQVEITTGIADD
ncbi:hypothetical protein F4X10_19205 [Candidatus Poribacteria bacterium]|nr:hypothetical protein [Candidatus Poribacteria bacterium]